MFNPITASQEIKDAFTDYITTTFDFADPDYADELKKSIQESGAVAKGPYLEVSGSYESGESIAELIAEHMLNLTQLSKYKENNRIEAKKAQGGLPHSIWETYSAFANTFGGYILLGVVENADKSFSSVPLPAPEKLVSDFWNSVNNHSIVNVNILSDRNVQIVESGDNQIVVIEVPRADRHDKPVYTGVDPFTGTYRRNGEGDYRCTKDEVRAMMRDQADISQDARVMDTMTIDCLDRDTIRRYRQRMDNLRPGHVWSELAVEDFLHRIGAMARDADGKLRPTAAGLLMFGHEYEIVREFPHYFLDYQEHDRSATEDERWTDRIVSSSGDWSGNICDFYFRVYNRIAQDIKVPFKLEGTDRIDDTPLHKALREALANALIHADYYDRRGLVIQKWPDKIRIANPGAFRINVQEALVGGVSDPRNESLIKMFNLINVGERAGSGLPSIRSVWQKQGWQVPEIVEAFNPDRTTLTLPLSAAKMAVKSGGKKVAAKNGDKEGGIAERRKADILQYLTDTPKAASKEIAEAVGLQVSRTKMYLAELIEQEAVVAEGAGRARKYRLKT